MVTAIRSLSLFDAFLARIDPCCNLEDVAVAKSPRLPLDRPEALGIDQWPAVSAYAAFSSSLPDLSSTIRWVALPPWMAARAASSLCNPEKDMIPAG
jgi:hypothetical protein